MSNEWGRQDEPDYTGMILTFVFLVSALLLVSAIFSGCAPRQWPEIGENVRVEKVVIRECKQGEC